MIRSSLVVMLDANIWLSYMIGGSTGRSAIAETVEWVFTKQCDLVITPSLMDEIQQWSSKPKLVDRLTEWQVDTMIAHLKESAILVEDRSTDLHIHSRDENDDYLLDAAANGGVDILVTGDKDLLKLRDQLARPLIVTAAEFVRKIVPER